jgi:hypothetical protein
MKIESIRIIDCHCGMQCAKVEMDNGDRITIPASEVVRFAEGDIVAFKDGNGLEYIGRDD